ncbi:MAG: hypothetical protein GY816_21715 [Cytophagales bacterium]|nr:hypothetical protein [Cytophagales bacterium]
MNKAFFYLFLKPFSMLPLSVIYAVTYPFYLLLAHVIQYRKKVVIKNLTNSFPEKGLKEIKEIKKKFYRHFLDEILESIKMISMSDKECLRRLKVVNPEILKPYFDQGRSVAMVIGHYNNWEFTPFMNAQIKHQYVALYTPLRNAFMNQTLYNARSKFGAGLIAKKKMGSFIRRPHDTPYLLIFASDQSPKATSKLHWTQFLKQKTGVATGTERYAKMLNLVTVFGRLEKVKRGHYEITMEVLTDTPKEEAEGNITEMHVRALEKVIIQTPQYWLWSHRRWKKKVEKNLEK